MTELVKQLSREKFNQIVTEKEEKNPLFRLIHINACFEYSYVYNNKIIKLICTQ